MTANSKIEWTDHTFNPWVGCTKVSPGCDHCYAESWAKRSGMVAWGGPRRRTSSANWRQPVKWNTAAAAAGRRDRVFCASLADVFDNDVDPRWRADLMSLILETPNLDWLLLTKRIGNAARMLSELVPSWSIAPWPNVWIGATIVNQEEADRDIPKLLETRAAVRFLSCEPLLGPIDFSADDGPNGPGGTFNLLDLGLLHWVIAGGESGHHARPMHPEWVRSLRDQCVAAHVPFLFKQWGEWLPGHQYEASHRELDADLEQSRFLSAQWDGARWDLNHIVAQDEWDEHALYRVGRSAAGRKLDGSTWDEFPKAVA